MEELMLLENPRGWYGQTRRHSRVAKKRRNPMARTLAMPATIREWTQGVDIMDTGAAVGGLAASTLIPAAFVKVTDTGTQKLWKVAVSLLSAIGAGFLGRQMISPSAGKAAVIGGLAGTAVIATGLFTNIRIIGNQTGVRGPSPRSRLGESRFEPGPGAEAGVQVSVT